jgi:hypothetical protein
MMRRRLQGDVLELFLGHLDEDVLVERIALDDVLVGHLLAGVGVDLHVLDAVSRLPIQLIEGDLLAFRGGRVERHGARDEREAEEAFPVGARGHVTRYSVSGAERCGASMRSQRRSAKNHRLMGWGPSPRVRGSPWISVLVVGSDEVLCVLGVIAQRSGVARQAAALSGKSRHRR